MDRKGFEIIRDIADPGSVAPEPVDGEDLRFVTVGVSAESRAALFERLSRAGLLSDSVCAPIVEAPSLDVYASTERTVTFIDRNAQERPDYDFSHLEEKDKQLVREIEEAEDGISMASLLYKSGFTYEDLAKSGGFSRNTIKTYINDHKNRGRTGNLVGTRFHITMDGVRNAFLGLVGREGFSIDKARFTLALFYEAGARKSLHNPFVLDEDIRKMVERLYTGQPQAD